MRGITRRTATIMGTAMERRGREHPRLVAVLMAVFATVLGLAAMPQSAVAHQADTRFKLDFYELKCLEETDLDGNGAVDAGTSHDEPYVIFFVSNLRQPGNLFLTGSASRTAVFGNVDTGDVRRDAANPRLWGFNGTAAPVVNASDLIVLAAVIEHDSSSADAIVAAVQSVLVENLNAYVAQGNSRATIVEKLIRDMNAAIDTEALATANHITNPDDRLGGAKEPHLTHGNLDSAAAGSTVYLSLEFRDSAEDATYRVKVRLAV